MVFGERDAECPEQAEAFRRACDRGPIVGRCGEEYGESPVARLDDPGNDRAKVVEFGDERPERRVRRVSPGRDRRIVECRHQPIGKALGNARGLASGRACEQILARRLVQTNAVAVVHERERHVAEPCDDPRCVLAHERAGGLDRSARDRKGERDDGGAVGRLERVDAPCDRGLERAMVFDLGSAFAAAEQRGRMLEVVAGSDVARAHARGGEFDREGNAIERSRDARGSRGVDGWRAPRRWVTGAIQKERGRALSRGVRDGTALHHQRAAGVATSR